MNVINMKESYDAEFVRAVERESGQNVSLCYQCGNCTAGCPYTEFYDLPVSRIMRGLQAGQRDALLSCRSLWLCATCESCTTRCPNNIDVATIMDVLRHMARKAGKAPEPAVKTFCDAFLDSVRRHGRVFEMGLMTRYMARTGRFLSDVDLSLKVLPKRKLAMRPHDIVGKESIARIYERYDRKEGKQ
ncbi:MAG: 4Fe-4S dicluster domain-containing protein [Pseudodesulfovibrio sp.]|jgi:heterodisulfide reductase subunit C|uniref:Heterodisulfide reductase subunit C n=1 Tax=Pseudodesulfovibrio indicus TaxID=1716143 RepID=A0A126QJ31_9BACT|nr:4Fe-4S dicluster domain-containing protein [Pseudodesulfovibrio indicus]AMK09993.1 heterodisulfide reductase subunit C [Pseudodesulfovibrio indicus]TDT87042.1 heterodisulfide reductase subunit C [Pseudodesulfovibrio indicus]